MKTPSIKDDVSKDVDAHLLERIENDFTYHPPSPEKIEHHGYMRVVAKNFARAIITRCPPGRERSLALTKLEEVAMWANAAIARYPAKEID